MIKSPASTTAGCHVLIRMRRYYYVHAAESCCDGAVVVAASLSNGHPAALTVNGVACCTQ